MILYGERLLPATAPPARARCSRSPTRSGSPRTTGAGLLGIPDAANGRGLREAGVLPNAGPGPAADAATPRRPRRTRAIAAALAAGELTRALPARLDPLRDLPDARAVGARARRAPAP